MASEDRSRRALRTTTTPTSDDINTTPRRKPSYLGISCTVSGYSNFIRYSSPDRRKLNTPPTLIPVSSPPQTLDSAMLVDDSWRKMQNGSNDRDVTDRRLPTSGRFQNGEKVGYFSRRLEEANHRFVDAKMSDEEKEEDLKVPAVFRLLRPAFREQLKGQQQQHSQSNNNTSRVSNGDGGGGGGGQSLARERIIPIRREEKVISASSFSSTNTNITSTNIITSSSKTSSSSYSSIVAVERIIPIVREVKRQGSSTTVKSERVIPLLREQGHDLRLQQQQQQQQQKQQQQKQQQQQQQQEQELLQKQMQQQEQELLQKQQQLQQQKQELIQKQQQEEQVQLQEQLEKQQQENLLRQQHQQQLEQQQQQLLQERQRQEQQQLRLLQVQHQQVKDESVSEDNHNNHNNHISDDVTNGDDLEVMEDMVLLDAALGVHEVSGPLSTIIEEDGESNASGSLLNLNIKCQNGKDLQDGHYFIKLLENEIFKLEELICDFEEDMNDCSIQEDVRESILAAVGKAKLLMAQKLAQFRGLCDKNITVNVAEDPFVPTCQDLAGFWDMVYIQVEHIHSLFAELTVFRQNGWRKIEPAKINVEIVTKKPKPKKLTTPTTTTSEASKARDEIRRKLMEEKKRLMRELRAGGGAMDSRAGLCSFVQI